ncbi:hypothetical protein VTK56DRAFT_8242 [Thermocarpiscus australiensis]
MPVYLFSSAGLPPHQFVQFSPPWLSSHHFFYHQLHHKPRPAALIGAYHPSQYSTPGSVTHSPCASAQSAHHATSGPGTAAVIMSLRSLPGSQRTSGAFASPESRYRASRIRRDQVLSKGHRPGH